MSIEINEGFDMKFLRFPDRESLEEFLKKMEPVVDTETMEHTKRFVEIMTPETFICFSTEKFEADIKQLL